MTPLLELFRGCREEIHPSSSVCEAPAHTRFVKQAQTPFPLQNSPKNKNGIHTTNNISRIEKEDTTNVESGREMELHSSDCDSRLPESFMALTWPKQLTSPKIHGENNNDFPTCIE